MSEINKMTKEERRASFHKKVIHHPILGQVLGSLEAITNNCSGLSLCIVHGPTGVGKTTLVHKLEEKLYQRFKPDMEKNTGLIPICRVEAPAPESGKFHWRDMWIRMLESMHEPLIDKKLPSDKPVPTEQSVRREAKGVSGPDVRRAVEACFKHRGTRFILVDEAQHLNKAPNARQMLDSMDAIKSLASLSGVFMVLAGTYEILDMLNLNGQLARRSQNLHFPRYRADISQEQHAFKSVIGTFQSALPFNHPFDLGGHYDYLYTGSLGCVGILKNWLDRAVALALEQDKSVLSLDDLKKSALAKPAIARIAKELQEGEQRLAKAENLPNDLAAILGIAPGLHGNGNVAETGMTNGKNHKPGVRNPKRDKTGTGSVDGSLPPS